jgi:hypothetical protein
MSQQRMPALQLFIDELRAIWALDPDMGSRMEKAKPHLARLVECKELQERSVDWPSTEGRKNLRESFEGYAWSHASIFNNVMTRLMVLMKILKDLEGIKNLEIVEKFHINN